MILGSNLMILGLNLTILGSNLQSTWIVTKSNKLILNKVNHYESTKFSPDAINYL